MSENTREEAYERVYDYIKHNTTALPNQEAVKEQQLKLALVAHGDLDVDEVDTALTALAEQDKIVRAGGWLTPCLDAANWKTRAIEFVVAQDDNPQAFVAAVNRV